MLTTSWSVAVYCSLANPKIGAVVVEVLHGVVQRVEYHWFAPHIGALPGSGSEESPVPGIGADRQRLSVRRLRFGRESGPERSTKPGDVEVEAAGGNPGRDVHDRSVLVAVLGVPSPRLEINLIHDLGVEEFVQAPGDAGGHGYAVHVVGILRVLSADMDLAGWRAGRAHDRLLQ